MTTENAINEIEQLKIEISKINVKLINIISEYISNEEMSDTHKVDIIDALANNNLVVRKHIKTLQNIQNIL
jgi:hypothetical protein